MDTLVVLALCITPSELIALAAVLHLLDSKHKIAPIVLLLAIVPYDLVLNHTDLIPPELAPPLSVLGIIGIRFVIPLLFSRKSLKYTLFISTVTFFLLSLVAGVFVGLYLIFSGRVPTDEAVMSNLSLMAVLKLAQNLLEIIVFALFVHIIKQRDTDNLYFRDKPWIALFTFPQLAICLILLSINTDVQFTSITTSIAVSAACALFIVADLLFYYAVLSWVEKKHKQAQTEAILLELKQQQAEYEALRANIEALSKLRHDFANHAQTIEYLCKTGNTAEAQKQVAQLKRLVELGDASCR